MADRIVREALDPNRSAAVLASAGTGKTWLLAKRMLRILVADPDTDPGSLLALTFTNRAAGEMRDRLFTYARELATVEDAALPTLLEAMGLDTGADTVAAARGAYGRLAAASFPPRISTFHSFCQDILARFPVEAGVPPGFELLTNEREPRAAAWDRLMDDSAGDHGLRAAFDILFDAFGRPARVRALLMRMLDRRGDWWAWCEGQPDPVAFASDRVAAIVNAPPPDFDPCRALRAALEPPAARIARVLHEVRTGTAVTRAAALADALADASRGNVGAVEAAWNALHVQGSGEPLTMSKSFGEKKLRGAIGDTGFETLVTDWTVAAAAVNEVRGTLAAHRTAERNTAWFHAGARLVVHYQAVKRALRMLDFNDLEWSAYRLLTAEGHAEWVQYKLDRRIEHLLVDEFQDTNPTQWRLLKPVLDEMAAGDPERDRSVFIVGDAKQSIYRFRRARPELLEHAAGWLRGAESLAPGIHSLALSRRSAPPVIDVVNAMFRASGHRDDHDPRWILPGFEPHATTETGTPGHAEIVGFEPPENDGPAEGDGGLRDPLQAGRPEPDARDFRAEADWIATRIHMLVTGGAPVVRNGVARRAGWDDCMVLLRQRTHAGEIEDALRRRGIPYESASRGMLLHRLEVRDVLALLEVLVAPWNDLALAQVLRSPVFDADDRALATIAATKPHRGAWFKALAAIAASPRAPVPLARAHRCLESWRTRANRLPVHDLVDQIFCEGDLITRFVAAAPVHQQAGVRANLSRVLELALETDAGRYPTLARFVERLHDARDAGDEELDDAPLADPDGRVRVLTIHGAKGLEAPFVFLAQAWSPPRRGSLGVVVDWPADGPRPTAMMLLDGSRAPAGAGELLDAEAGAAAVEDADLLYVALTRARQHLYVTGTAPRGGRDDGWLPRLRACWPVRDADGNPAVAASAGDAFAVPEPTVPAAPPLPSALRGRRTATPATAVGTAPGPDRSGHGGHAERRLAGLRGDLIHRALELLTATAIDRAGLAESLASEYGLAHGTGMLDDCVGEALRVYDAPSLRWMFDAEQAWNEIPMTALEGGSMTHGVADRVVVDGDTVWIIDYKSHRDADARRAGLVEAYRTQLARYESVAEKVWPGRRIRAGLLFTAIPEFVAID